MQFITYRYCHTLVFPDIEILRKIRRQIKIRKVFNYALMHEHLLNKGHKWSLYSILLQLFSPVDIYLIKGTPHQPFCHV